jgi:sugar phosphate isomerase/epimerase
MRLGGPVFEKYDSPEAWVQAVQALGYRAAYCPVGVRETLPVIQAYARAALQADIVIAEVGVWDNPLSPVRAERKTAIVKNQACLALADEIGARCCVNIAGSRGTKWDGPAAADLTDETFDMIVENVRLIIDAVQPKRTFYTLEPMPWMYPDSAESYLRLIKAIDRQAFAAHLDPVNMVSSPQLYFRNADLLRECVAKLGPYIRSVHAKDIALRDHLTVHLDEMRPGLGGLDYGVFLSEVARLDPDTPLMLEHLPQAADYTAAAEFVRAAAAQVGVNL